MADEDQPEHENGAIPADLAMHQEVERATTSTGRSVGSARTVIMLPTIE